jgi:hypothetical protein
MVNGSVERGMGSEELIALGPLEETDECLILLDSIYAIDIYHIRGKVEILRRKLIALRSSLLA